MLRTVLVPLDGSAFGEHALPWALSLARRAEATLRIVHVAQPPSVGYSEAALYILDDLRREARARALEYLNSVTRRIKDASGVPVEAEVLEGDVATAVCEEAARCGADLVVMGTHGRGPLGRFWLGGVADEMLRYSPAPLLLVRPDEKTPDLKEEKAVRHILIPLDGEPLAETILEPAMALAGLTGAASTLFRVVRPALLPPPLPETGTVSEQVRLLTEKVKEVEGQQCREAMVYLDKVAERFRARGLSVQTSLAVEERPGVAILHAAEQTTVHVADELAPHPHRDVAKEPAPVDLIALETHGARGLKRLVVGSVADKVIRGAHVPVLVHRPLQKG